MRDKPITGEQVVQAFEATGIATFVDLKHAKPYEVALLFTALDRGDLPGREQLEAMTDAELTAHAGVIDTRIYRAAIHKANLEGQKLMINQVRGRRNVKGVKP